MTATNIEPPQNVVSAPDGTQVRIVAVPISKSPLGEMMRSKKFLAMLAGLLFSLLAKVGVDVSAETQEHVLNLVMVYIGAQGVADAGQGFARVKNTQPSSTTTPT